MKTNNYNKNTILEHTTQENSSKLDTITTKELQKANNEIAIPLQKSTTNISTVQNTSQTSDFSITEVQPKTAQILVNTQTTPVATTLQHSNTKIATPVVNIVDPLEALSDVIETAMQSETTLIKNDSINALLSNLLFNINDVDFEILAYPNIKELKKEIETLRILVFNQDGSTNDDNKTEIKEFQKLTKQLSSYKVTKNHYLILCVEQLLTTAENNNWGLCKKNNFIYLFNGSYWCEIDKEGFQYFLGQTALKMGVEKFKAKIHNFKDDLFKQFLSDAYLPTPEPKKDCVLINLQNGTFEITSKKRGLRKFEQSDFITHQLPFEYDLNATAPMFQKYLNEVLPDIEKQKVLAEFCGYIFIKPSVLKLEKMLILYGTGANGKSVFFEILNALLGSQNICNYSLQSLTDSTGYCRAKIGTKLVNYASEINGKLETDVFKQMASGEPIEARLPYGDPFILNDYAKLIFNCNELPKDVEHTNAYFRRFLIIGFDVTIPEDKQDKQLPIKIINKELSGVFNWILEGLDRLLIQKNFSKCDAIDNARSDYERQSDSVRTFVDEFEYKKSVNEYTLIKNLYDDYKIFCIDDGFRPVNKNNFKKRLEAFNIYVKRLNVGVVAYISNLNK